MRGTTALLLAALMLAGVSSACSADKEKRHEPAAAVTAVAAQEKPVVQAKAPANAPLSDESMFHLDATWTDHNGRPVTLSQLRGQPFVITMVFTTCQGACPMLARDMKVIERRLSPAAKKQVRYVIVSFDPERDTPEKLNEFAKSHELSDDRWTLLTGSPDDVRDLAAVLGVRYKQQPNGDFDHSNALYVVDGEGVMRHQQEGLRQDPTRSVEVLEGLVGS